MKTFFSIAASLLLFLGFTLSAHAETHHWGFKRSVNGEQPDAGATYNELLEKHGAYYKGSPEEKIVYFTFDNGFENGYTEKILDVLKEEKVPATFFLTGHYLESAAPLVKRMVKDGHIIGNHSWGHPDFSTLSEAQMKEEWAKVKKKTEELTGQKEMKYVRPPEGVFNELSLKVANDEGYTHVFWSLAFVDWYHEKPQGADYAYNEIMKQLHPGAVILLHTVSSDNAGALQRVIQDMKKQGYKFETLDHLTQKQS
ncbi:delta-lactam-biosynthetic de-N-acetylase [Jeotgalibacillus haloalkalitolerans]|uniref:Delta-lactam-biosynthetic de-N-acetylase n=1 Tax=Jeotgalibacillus haloalkalitolerans TaxID=3104292 RepID=A0ABU5KQF0_9BACL|nr:delta-lactam-biosynthetic de-N-acetylase [Jeotgalibacillus sp. HH7-29]MDZ5713384.1 delta-lactam-biosynthetic de-N-acetylase [Jeotgalibacillus sp. HH7-29]